MNSSSEPLPTSLEEGMPPISISNAAPQMMPLTTSTILAAQRRRRKAASLKRSRSTPNVRGHYNSDSGMDLAEKKRNKLGYHRTSVACGHCRRRKIRCLLAPDDPQNRCANCIRLKKDCNFFPVDQQPQSDRRPRNPSGGDTRTSSSSESSPTIATGYMIDHRDQYNTYPPLALQNNGFPSATSSSTGINSGLVSPLTRPPVETTRTFEPPPTQQRGHWGSPFIDTMSAGQSSPGDGSYWGRRVDSPMTPGYSPHMPGPTHSFRSSSDARSSFTSFAPSRENSTAWSIPSMPARSMSFGVIDDLPGGYQTQGFPASQPVSMDYRHRASEMHPPSLMTSNNSSNTSISEAHIAPLSAPLTSPPVNHWGLPPAWNALPSSAVTKPGDFGSWYAEPQLAKVQEEEIASTFSGEPAILYAGHQ